MNEQFKKDILQGLQNPTQKKLPSRYFYDKKGIISRIEEYESFGGSDDKLIYSTVFKVNRKVKHIDKSVVAKLNSVLLESD